jgi:hypothetical protein
MQYSALWCCTDERQGEKSVSVGRRSNNVTLVIEYPPNKAVSHPLATTPFGGC